jgi:uncharacterized protein involved in response to NO
MFAAGPAKFLHLQALGGRFLILGGRIVPVFALCALERDDFARHPSLLLLHTIFSAAGAARNARPENWSR